MRKKLWIFALLIFLSPIEVFAETYIVTNCSNVPVQESYTSQKVIAVISNPSTVSKINSFGEFYEISFNNIKGWINRAYTVEGFNEIQSEKNAQANSNSSSNSSSNYSSADWENLTSDSTFAEVAAARKKYVIAHNYYYSQSGPIVPANYKKTRTVDCSSFVSDVIYYYGKAKDWSGLMSIGRKTSHYFNGVGEDLKGGGSNSYFERIPSVSAAQPGDILCYNGHVEIYAGGSSGGHPKVYNCGGNDSIRGGVITKSAYTSSGLTHILRVKYR